MITERHSRAEEFSVTSPATYGSRGSLQAGEPCTPHYNRSQPITAYQGIPTVLDVLSTKGADRMSQLHG